MKTHSRSNNLVAILIALLLFAIGFVLYFIHEQTDTDDSRGQSRAGDQARAIVLSASGPGRPGS